MAFYMLISVRIMTGRQIWRQNGSRINVNPVQWRIHEPLDWDALMLPVILSYFSILVKLILVKMLQYIVYKTVCMGEWVRLYRFSFHQLHFMWHMHDGIVCMSPGGRFENAYELLTLRALKISMFHKTFNFQCMGKIFGVEFQRCPLKFDTKYLTNTLKDAYFIHGWKFMSSKI